MIKFLNYIVMFVFMLHICGCTYYIVSFEDISNKAPYSAVVNSTFKTKAELIMYGYNLNSTPGKEIHEYSITSPPGPSNRYVLSRKRIASGTNIKIVAVKRCTDCFLDFKPRIKLEVASNEIIKDLNVPIFLDDNLLVNSWEREGQAMQFNNEYFIRVKPNRDIRGTLGGTLGDAACYVANYGNRKITSSVPLGFPPSGSPPRVPLAVLKDSRARKVHIQNEMWI